MLLITTPIKKDDIVYSRATLNFHKVHDIKKDGFLIIKPSTNITLTTHSSHCRLATEREIKEYYNNLKRN